MNKPLISPSLMCANLNNFKAELDLFAAKGIELLHIDVMDGSFVPNLALGTDFVRQVRQMSSIPLDIHVMVDDPERMVSWFELRPEDRFAFHIESTHKPLEAIKNIKETGAYALIALSPATDFKSVEPYLSEIDGFLIMTVNPGFAGKKIVDSSFEKVKRLIEYYSAKKKDLIYIVDGNITFEYAKLFRSYGANVFVGGTSSIYHKDDSVENNIDKLRAALID